MVASFVCCNMVHWIMFDCIRIYIFQLMIVFHPYITDRY